MMGGLDRNQQCVISEGATVPILEGGNITGTLVGGRWRAGADTKQHSTPLALAGETIAKTIAPRAIKNVRSLRIVVSMTFGPERPDAAKGDR